MAREADNSERRKRKPQRASELASGGLLGPSLVQATSVLDYWHELFLGVQLACSPGKGAAMKTVELAQKHSYAAAEWLAAKCGGEAREQLRDSLMSWVAVHFRLADAVLNGRTEDEISYEVSSLYALTGRLAECLAFVGAWEAREGFENRFREAADAFVELLAEKSAKNRAGTRKALEAANAAWVGVGGYASECFVATT